jgi:hypothetical protein
MSNELTEVNTDWAPKCPNAPAITKEDLFAEVDDMLLATGASEQCKKNASMQYATFEASAKVPFAQVSASATASNRIMSEAGCGTVFLSANNQLQTNQKIACIINQSMTGVTQTFTSNQKIIIQTMPLTDQETIAKSNLELAQVLALEKSTSENRDLLVKLFANQLKTYDRGINITRSTIAITSNIKMQTECSLQANQVSELSDQTKIVAADTAAQVLSARYGVDSGDPNLKSVIQRSQQISNASQDSVINSTIASAKVEVSQQGDIIIRAYGKIDIDRTEITNNLTVDLYTKAVMQNAVTAGIQTATEIITKYDSGQKTDLIVEGSNDLVKAIEDGVNNRKKTGLDDGNSFFLIAVVVIICLVIGGGIYYKFSGKGKDTSLEGR